ncbi:MAG: FHA domain-containing protein [Gammaproteobacteria bacterium]
MFLVDTSDPGRATVISKNATQIGQLLNSNQPHHIFGLANFDKNLNIKVPLGKNISQIRSSSSSLEAAGLTTELYRNTIKAIELLSRANADRKLLFLFSDGQAEDKAYYHEDVINAARSNGVVINSLGYPRSTSLSVALQTLRRLSEETGGVYIEADLNFELPSSFTTNPFSSIDKGGHFLIDLTSVNNFNTDSSRIELRFETSNDVLSAIVPVNLPRAIEAVIQQPVIALPPVMSEQLQPRISAPQQEPAYVELFLWYGVPVALIVLIILTLITLYLLFKKQQPDSNRTRIAYAEVKPLAYLITQDEKSKSYPVTSSTWRIGRSLDNEMTIPDNSISRRHAEIQRESNGQFVVYDRGSSNGVYVNNKKISRHILSEGEILEIGDVFFRFTQNPLDYQYADDTEMMNTRAPDYS